MTKTTPRKKFAGVSFDADMLCALDQLATKRRVTRSSLINQYLVEGLDRDMPTWETDCRCAQ